MVYDCQDTDWFLHTWQRCTAICHCHGISEPENASIYWISFNGVFCNWDDFHWNYCNLRADVENVDNLCDSTIPVGVNFFRVSITAKYLKISDCVGRRNLAEIRNISKETKRKGGFRVLSQGAQE